MRRRGQSEERRRRVLKDDLSDPEGSGEVGSADSTRTAAAYKSSALQEQPRITDLIPQAGWLIFLLFVSGAAAISGLLLAYDRLEPAAQPRFAIFDLTHSGSLAHWLAACLLALVAAVAGICHCLRRHKLTDYHGRYRIWRWTAGLALLASVAATTQWHAVAGQELARAAAWNLPHQNLLGWLVPTVLVLTTIAIRLAVEMRASRIATLSLYLALACYAVVVGSLLWPPTALAKAHAVMATSGSLLAGHLLLLLSFTWYARYIILEMQGLAGCPKSKRSPRRAAHHHGRHITTHNHYAHPSPPPPKRQSDVDPQPATRRNQQLVEEAEHEAERLERQEHRAQRKKRDRRRHQMEPEEPTPVSAPHKKLTKAERKRLRKLKAQQREAA